MLAKSAFLPRIDFKIFKTTQWSQESILYYILNLRATTRWHGPDLTIAHVSEDRWANQVVIRCYKAPVGRVVGLS